MDDILNKKVEDYCRRVHEAKEEAVVACLKDNPTVPITDMVITEMHPNPITGCDGFIQVRPMTEKEKFDREYQEFVEETGLVYEKPTTRGFLVSVYPGDSCDGEPESEHYI